MMKVFTDGGSRGNPGPAASGVYITDEENVVSERIGVYLGNTTNNVAEYTAVIIALQWLLDHPQKTENVSEIHFFMDSRLVCSQLTGLFKVKHPNMIPLFLKSKDLERRLPVRITYTHIPREKNKEADSMVNKTLDNLV